MYIVLPFAVAGFLILALAQHSVMLVVGTLLFFGFFAFILRCPEVGTLVVLFSIYSNISVLAMRSQSAIQLTAGPADKNPRVAIVLAGLSLLLTVPLVFHLFIRKEKLIFDPAFILMSALLAVYLSSSAFASDLGIIRSQVSGYVLEGMVLYFLITNVVRDLPTLRRVTWTLLLAGSLMGGLSIFQKATHTENNIYGGLAQVSSDFDLEAVRQTSRSSLPGVNGEVAGQVRAAGPIGETNRYGQMLVVLLPLGVLRFRVERSRRLRAFALVSIALIIGALFLTLSRGSLLAASAVFVLMVSFRLLKLRQFVAATVVLVGVVLFVTPSVLSRVASLEGVAGLLFRQRVVNLEPDSSAIRRYVLNVATWHVFLDHPLLGVGPGQFSQHYSQVYGNRVGLVEQRQSYRGHNLYLEALAETGAIGLMAFLAIGFVIMRGLWMARRQLLRNRPDLAATASAFFLCLAAYAISAIFDHLSYQRYLWLLLALSSATVRILHSHSDKLSITGPFLRQGDD